MNDEYYNQLFKYNRHSKNQSLFHSDTKSKSISDQAADLLRLLSKEEQLKLFAALNTTKQQDNG